MAWAAVAIGGATLASGYMASKSASKQAKSASKSDAASLAFERERYDDWNETYGPLQDNLANYYSNITPDYYASVGLEAFQQQFQTSMQRLDETFAQRGIDPSSGLATSIEAQAELGAAETRAGIRRDAPRQAAEDQSRFLQIGLGQNPSSSLSSTLANQAQSANQRAMQSSQSAGQAVSAAIPAVGRAIDAYVNRPASPVTSGSGAVGYVDHYSPNVGVV